MPDHEIPYCHGLAMAQVAVNYVSPLSYDYRCPKCGRTVFVSDEPAPAVSVADFQRRNLPDEKKTLTMDEIVARLEKVGWRRRA